MQLEIIKPERTLHKAFLKLKPQRSEIDLLKRNLAVFYENLARNNDEEYLKTQLTYLLRDTWYKDQFQINPIAKADLAIHTGVSPRDSIGVILEVKSIANKVEMITDDRPNVKALHELILYYMRERIDNANNELKHLVATNAESWYIFDANEFDKKIFRHPPIKKLYEIKINDHKDNPFFYEELYRILEKYPASLQVCKIALSDHKKMVVGQGDGSERKLIILNKILSPIHLLKRPIQNDSNQLDTRFYEELLHLIGLEEVQSGSKKVIQRLEKPHSASLIENTIIKLLDHDVLRKVTNLSSYGPDKKSQLFSIALELCITWINRILFSKLLEAQLFSYNKQDKGVLFLNTKIIPDFDELNTLFFQILAEAPGNRHEHLKEHYRRIPYLNSSLFERTELENETVEISNLNSRLEIPLFGRTILTDVHGKRKSGSLRTIDYLFEFLDAYDFSSEASQEIQEKSKRLISASVLGLIFEKINGYKDGSFFTPGTVTMFMCRNAIEATVIKRFNQAKNWTCSTLNDLYNKIEDKKEANKIINGILICDPAVGSGHFLVSALNELIAIKSELGILQDKSGRGLRDYSIEVVNDELIISDENGELFQYNPQNKESQRVQETLFHEKEMLIEKCLFGVDINSNSVKICRLRLWIELLKHSYYKDDSHDKELETLPNIDINIKCGNSIISRFSLDTPVKVALKNSKWTIEEYKNAVQDYRTADSKARKRELEQLISNIKADFRSYISPNDAKFKKLSKLRGDLQRLTQSLQLFDQKTELQVKADKAEVAQIKKSIAKIEAEIAEIRANKIFDSAFEWRFEFPEALNEAGDFEGFDIILGNPPYGVKFDNSEKSYIKNRYRSYQYKFESFVYFIDLALDLLKPYGVLDFITPIIWLSLDNCFPIRKIAVKENDIRMLYIHGEGVFEEAVVNTCSFQIEKRAPVADFRIINGHADFIADKSKWIDEQNLSIEYRLTPESMEIVKKIRSRSTPLKEFGTVIQGITPYDSYQGQSQEIIKSRAYHSTSKKDNTYGKWLEGTDLSRFSIQWSGNWLSYGDWLAAPRETKYFTGPRLLFREVPGKGKRIQAATTSELYYYGHSISPFKPFEEFETDINFFLGVCNSKLISWYGRYTLPNFGKDIFPKLNPNDIKELPIPNIKDLKVKISKLVAEIIVEKKRDATVDTASLEMAIDQELYRNYGLSEAEIAIVNSD